LQGCLGVVIVAVSQIEMIKVKVVSLRVGNFGYI
jgi:hypothetical protein